MNAIIVSINVNEKHIITVVRSNFFILSSYKKVSNVTKSKLVTNTIIGISKNVCTKVIPIKYPI